MKTVCLINILLPSDVIKAVLGKKTQQNKPQPGTEKIQFTQGLENLFK